MKVELDRKGIEDLVKGSNPPMEMCITYEALKRMKFCGNQHNENWCWNQEYLDSLSEEDLFALYLQVRDSEYTKSKI